MYGNYPYMQTYVIISFHGVQYSLPINNNTILPLPSRQIGIAPLYVMNQKVQYSFILIYL